MSSDTEKGSPGSAPNQSPASGADEGEGSRSGARQYNESAHKFVEDGKVKNAAQEAVEAVEGPEKAELEKAEAKGKSHSHGEDPAIGKKA